MVRSCPTAMALALACAALLIPETSRAQGTPPRLPRADASLSVGWLHAEVFELTGTRDNWANQRATLAGQAGLYWTEHLKTEVTVERSTTETVWEGIEVPLPDGPRAWRHAEHAIQDTRITVGQFYQFGHNAWAHVALGGGVVVSGRRRTSTISPLIVWDRTGERLLANGSTESDRTTDARAFAAFVSKAYVTPRVFVRSDIQADFRTTLDAFVLRVGMGVDF